MPPSVPQTHSKTVNAGDSRRSFGCLGGHVRLIFCNQIWLLKQQYHSLTRVTELEMCQQKTGDRIMCQHIRPALVWSWSQPLLFVVSRVYHWMLCVTVARVALIFTHISK